MSDNVTVHLHALCWNEARLLPYFFRHYDQVVDRYFVYDNGSTDGSLELLKQNPRVVLGTFDAGESFVHAAMQHYNQCWKQSRGQADWVFIVNIDEHLYHPCLMEYLRACTRHGVTVILPEGYNMISDAFPTTSEPLWKTIRYGARDPIWDKAEFFDPNRIEEINFREGRHSVSPSGDVTYPRSVRTKLLHFKYLGADYLVERHAELASKIPSQDLARGWAYQYTWDRERNLEELQRCRTNAVCVV
jgi:hypothetical protein